MRRCETSFTSGERACPTAIPVSTRVAMGRLRLGDDHLGELPAHEHPARVVLGDVLGHHVGLAQRSYLSITLPRVRTRIPSLIGSTKLNSILACSPACTRYLLCRRCSAWLAIRVGGATPSASQGCSSSTAKPCASISSGRTRWSSETNSSPTCNVSRVSFLNSVSRGSAMPDLPRRNCA